MILIPLGCFFKSLALRDIRIYAEVNSGNVFRYKDSSNLEIDFVVQLIDGRWGAFEIKMGSNEFDKAASNLIKLRDKVDKEKIGEPSFLGIISATEYAYQREDGI